MVIPWVLEEQLGSEAAVICGRPGDARAAQVQKCLLHAEHQWRETVIKVIRQRLGGHTHLEAVADALSAVPRSMPFASLEELRTIAVPTAVVASNDEADPDHPFAVGEAYADLIPAAQLVSDEPGRFPIAWQGSQLSRVIADVAAKAAA